MVPKPLLYQYQQNWVKDKSRFKIGMFSRQTGKTFITTFEIALDVVEKEALGKKTTWIIGSASERQAKIAIEDVKLHLKALKAGFKEYNIKLENNETALEIRFKNGSKIIGIPAKPNTVRGFSGNVYLDEFAFHENSSEIWKALFPIISSNPDYRLIITSTPNGKSNKFYELMTTDKGDWSKHIVDIYTAVKLGAPRDIEELKRNLNDTEAWEQEYELKWRDSSSNWLSHDLIMGAESELAGDFTGYQGGKCFIGNDIAARGDLWVAWILEQVGDVLVTREIITQKNISFAEQDSIMDNLFNKYNIIKLAIDQTGMGEKPVEDAIRRYGQSRVEGVLFTAQNKLHLANVGKQAFEDKKIRIPAGDSNLRADLYSIKKVIGSSGNPRLIAERENGSHADRAWACFLALYAAESDYQPYKYHKASRYDQGQRPLNMGRGNFKSIKGAI